MLKPVLEFHGYYSPWGHSCDVVWSWEQESVVVPKLACDQVVADTCHLNTDTGECRTINGLLYVATDTDMDLEQSSKNKGYLPELE